MFCIALLIYQGIIYLQCCLYIFPFFSQSQIFCIPVQINYLALYVDFFIIYVLDVVTRISPNCFERSSVLQSLFVDILTDLLFD